MRSDRTENVILASFGVAILVTVVLVLALFQSTQRAVAAGSMVQHTQHVLRRISGLRETLAVAESSNRGFLLTGDAQLRDMRDQALYQLGQYGTDLKAGVAESPIQRGRSQQLLEVLEEHITLVRAIDRPQTTHGAGVASQAFVTETSVRATQRINALVTGLEQEETRQLLSQQQLELQIHASMRRLLAFTGVAIALLVLPLLWGIFRLSQARHRAESRLRAIADSLPGAVFVVRRTPEGVRTYEFLSVSAGTLLGISREEVLRDVSVATDFVIEEDRDVLNAAVARSWNELADLEVDLRIRKHDGEIRWVRSSAIPFRQANGDLILNGYWLDITEIKNTEHALRHAMQRLQDAHSVAGLGDWTCNLATGAMTWSPQIYRMLQHDPAVAAPNLEEAVKIFENGAEATAEAFFKAQETGESQDYEMTALLPSGSVAAVHVIVIPTLGEAGTVVGMHGTIQDITVRKALEQGLYQAKEAADNANRAKSAFLATMSHEIRTPLNGMLGLLELISLMPLQDEMRSALQGVRDSGKSLQRIIDDILDFSKVEAGKLEIRPEPTRIGDVMSALKRAHLGIASSHGLELHCSIDPRISPVIMVDGVRLQQILGNFISNAIKFTLKGRIELRVQLVSRNGNHERLRYEVEDTGIGISPERQRRLFQPFEQAEDNFAARPIGTGLGLAICKRLAELMGGEVSMTSEVDKGTTMTLNLPVTSTDLQPAELPCEADPARTSLPRAAAIVTAGSRTEVEEPAIGDGPLVLVVDDHPINRMLMRRQLNSLGYASEDAGSGAEALEKWKTGTFALVLTDCNMPGLSGYDLSRQIRDAEAAEGSEPTPIIACSANVIGKVRQDCMDAGMDDYISKPIELATLSEKMVRWLPSKISAMPVTIAGPASNARAPLTGAAAPAEHAPRAEAAVPAATRPDAAPGRRVLDHFRKVNEVDVEKLLAAVAQYDMPAIAHLAHRIKGACGFIGETGLASVCSMVEQAGHNEDASAIDWLMELFHGELEQLNARLDAA